MAKPSYYTTSEFLNDENIFRINARDLIYTPSNYPQEVLNLLVPAVGFPLGSFNYKKYIDSIVENILSFNVSYTIDGASQITLELFDPQYQMAEANFFQIRQELIYRGMTFEVAAVEYGPGPGGSPSVKIEARNKAVQRMKREKDSTTVPGASGYEYARNAAAIYGLAFFGEDTPDQKNVVHGKASDKDNSVWSVLQSVAGSNQFMLYEIDGLLVYASQQYLLWQFGLQSRIRKSVSKPTGSKSSTTKGVYQRYSKLFFPNAAAGLSSAEYSDRALALAQFPSNPLPSEFANSDIIIYALAVKKYTNLIRAAVRKTSLKRNTYFWLAQDGKYTAVLPLFKIDKAEAGNIEATFIPVSEATNIYKKTGLHYGKFIAKNNKSSSERASAYAALLSDQVDKIIALGKDIFTNVAAFELATYPSFRRSDNDPLEGDGSVVVLKPNGQLLRPGQTALVGPYPTRMKGGYLITEVNYSELTPDPVQVTFRTPIKPEDQEQPE